MQTFCSNPICQKFSLAFQVYRKEDPQSEHLKAVYLILCSSASFCMFLKHNLFSSHLILPNLLPYPPPQIQIPGLHKFCAFCFFGF